MDRVLIFIYFTIACLLSSCATTPEDRFSLQEALASKVAISIPMQVSESGLIILKDIKIDGHELDMVLDTGATQSAIFETALKRLNLDIVSNNDTMVHGMIQSREHRVVELPNFEIGSIQYDSKSVVVLDDQDPDFYKMTIYDGLIGMDVLANYQIYASPVTNELRFISNEKPVFVSYYWPRVNLIKNPFQIDNRDLHFIELRVNGKKTPALLDTGAEFSAMNWPSASFVQAKLMRKRLREQWELQGAIGVFKPIARVKIDLLRGGQIFWENKRFIVMDFESLEILGVKGQPFVIAGINLFSDKAIFIDFERNFLSIVPENNDQKDTFETEL